MKQKELFHKVMETLKNLSEDIKTNSKVDDCYPAFIEVKKDDNFVITCFLLGSKSVLEGLQMALNDPDISVKVYGGKKEKVLRVIDGDDNEVYH